MCFFFFNDTATTEIYTLSLHDALPIWRAAPPPAPARNAMPSRYRRGGCRDPGCASRPPRRRSATAPRRSRRSEEHTSELQSRQYLVCRLLLEKKKTEIK